MPGRRPGPCAEPATAPAAPAGSRTRLGLPGGLGEEGGEDALDPGGAALRAGHPGGPLVFGDRFLAGKIFPTGSTVIIVARHAIARRRRLRLIRLPARKGMVNGSGRGQDGSRPLVRRPPTLPLHLYFTFYRHRAHASSACRASSAILQPRRLLRPERGSPSCGIAALAGATLILSEFSVPGKTLAEPPRQLPGRLPARWRRGRRTRPSWAGPVIPGSSASTACPPATRRSPSACSWWTPQERARGVVLFQSPIVQGAPGIGTVSTGDTLVPLVGLRVDPARVEDARCPLFPDSLAR